MYFDYIKEREGLDSIVTDYGFITYYVNGEECFIDILYIKPEFRQSKKGTELTDKVAMVARDNNCKYLTAKNFPKTFGCSEAMAASLAYGFKIIQSTNDYILLAKEL